MDINRIDTELNVKMIETLKYILRDMSVNISFELHNNIDELYNISLGEYNFKLYRYSENLTKYKINEKYYKIIPKKVKKKSEDEIIKYISKIIFNILVPFLGERFETVTDRIESYKLNYNNVIIELNKLTYERLSLYTNNVYKLKQLSTLNKKLGIDQTFNIILDDDIILDEMYKSFYNYFKDIIKK